MLIVTLTKTQIDSGHINMEPKDKKKTYKEKNGTTRVGDFLRGIGKVAPEILDLASAVSGYDGLSKLGDALRKDVGQNKSNLTDAQIMLALRELDLDMAESQEITKRWQADMTADSWLSKNVRPLVLAFLTLSMATLMTIDSATNTFTVEENWINLLSSLLLLVYGAYFGGRTLEKIRNMKRND